jgi:crossover junction endodeoxyribonuclease RuvC
MIIIGIDPGYRVTGYGIISYLNGQITYVTSGRINLVKLMHTAKLVFLAQHLNEIMDLHLPAAGACEAVFFAHNHQSCIKLGKIIGVASCIIAQRIPVVEYAPTVVKKAVCGTGKASKVAVLEQMQLLLRIPPHLSHDEADALAVAVCYLIENQGLVIH